MSFIIIIVIYHYHRINHLARDCHWVNLKAGWVLWVSTTHPTSAAGVAMIPVRSY
jgi:hypothetical protein